MEEFTRKGPQLNAGRSPNEGRTADLDATERRPDYMHVLGLLPPYSLEDIHKAYRVLAAAAHPDKGGSAEEFVKIQDAYHKAQQHVQFCKGRREWMASLVEPYAKQQVVVAEIHRRHGHVEIEKIDWMQHSFGDFATLADRLRRIDLHDSADADEFLKFLTEHHECLRFLDEIDLAGSDVTDAGLVHIAQIHSLKRLNVSRTRITAIGLTAIGELPELVSIDLAGIRFNWWDRRAIRNKLPRAKVVFK